MTLMLQRRSCFALVLVAWAAGVAGAQNLVITNARIVVGNGTVVPNGAVVVRDGRVVSAGPAAPAGVQGQRIDASGMTVMPGFIDAHRHIINGNDEQWFREQAAIRMREFLEAGYTTLMSGGGPVPGIVRLKERVEAGQLIGPRIITSGRVDPPTSRHPRRLARRCRRWPRRAWRSSRRASTPTQTRSSAPRWRSSPTRRESTSWT